MKLELEGIHEESEYKTDSALISFFSGEDKSDVQSILGRKF